MVSQDKTFTFNAFMITGEAPDNDYRNKGSRTLGKGNTTAGGMNDDGNEPVDEFGRVNKGPFTLRNGATYTGQWLDGQRDGIGTQLWPDGSRYEG